MKKILKFIADHWVLSSLAAAVIIFFVSMGIISANPPATAPVATVSPTTALTTQLSQVAGSSTLVNLTQKQIEANDALKGAVPVEVVSSTQFIEKLDAFGKIIKESTINPELHNIAVAYGTANATTKIFTAKYIDAQLPTILELLKTNNVDMNAIYATTATSTTSTTSGKGYYNGSWSNTGTSTTTSTTATTNNQTNPFNLAVNFAIYALLFFIALRFISRYIISRRQGKAFAAIGGSGNAGSESGKTEDGSEIPNTTFDDVAGCDEAIEEMKELVEFIQFPERFTKVGAKAPKGALLIGPPGTGKTLLARAVAGEAGIPFFSAAGSDFVEMYVGLGAKRVRELFAKARKSEKGAIVFIDEIDAIGRARGKGEHNNNSEQENTLNALLVELDGFSQSKVIILGATNREDMLDKALMRPGRLDKKVWVPLPDRQGRERILKVHTKNKPIEDNVDYTLIARRTPGMSGAELEQIANEAAMHAARENRETVTVDDFDNAIATVTMGKARKSAVITPEDRDLTAWHEAGHALCGLLQEDGMSPASISIIPRGHAGGVTHFPARDSGYMTRRQAYAQLVTAMGGMAAEQMHLGGGEFTTGPSSDLQQATNIALAMVTQYGMGETLIVKGGDILSASSTATDDALLEANQLLHQALEDAKFLLNSHKKLVDNFVEALIEYETLNNNQIQDLLAGHKIVATTSAPPAPRQTVRPEKSMVQKVRFKPVKNKKQSILGKVLSPLVKKAKNPKTL